MKAWNTLLDERLDEVLAAYPALRDYLQALQIPIFPQLPFRELPSCVSVLWLRDRGYTPESFLDDIRALVEEAEEQRLLAGSDDNERRRLLEGLEELTVCGGFDKDHAPERLRLSLHRGDTVCVTGMTGSGKTRLLEDIECLAARDTPSGRTVLYNGESLSVQSRRLLENRLCSYLSQSMNFVLELSCREFIELHAECRDFSDAGSILEQVLDCANSLAGEPFYPDTLITQLSGGQSRALMIADLVHVSAAPVVLIDEPENAGIDKHAVLDLLSGSGKIVLISTHEPVLALSCQKRIVLKNGAVSQFLTRSPQEEAILHEMRNIDRRLQSVRDALRMGEQL